MGSPHETQERSPSAHNPAHTRGRETKRKPKELNKTDPPRNISSQDSFAVAFRLAFCPVLQQSQNLPEVARTKLSFWSFGVYTSLHFFSQLPKSSTWEHSVASWAYSQIFAWSPIKRNLEHMWMKREEKSGGKLSQRDWLMSKLLSLSELQLCSHLCGNSLHINFSLF